MQYAHEAIGTPHTVQYGHNRVDSAARAVTVTDIRDGLRLYSQEELALDRLISVLAIRQH